MFLVKQSLLLKKNAQMAMAVVVDVGVCVGGGGGGVELHQFSLFRRPLVDINFCYYEVLLHAECFGTDEKHHSIYNQFFKKY